MTARKFTPATPRSPDQPVGKIELHPPEEIGEEIEASTLQRYMPAVMVAVMVIMVGVMGFNMFANGGHQVNMQGLIWPFMILMFAGFMARQGYGVGAKSVAEINTDRKAYARYLSETRERVTRSAAQQVTYWSHHGPHPLDTVGLIGGPRMWSRRPDDTMFLATRVTVGAAPAEDELLHPGIDGDLIGPDAAPQPYLEPVQYMAMAQFLRAHSLVANCPKLVSLNLHPTISIGGNPQRAANLLRAMICQLALFHSPKNLQIRVRTNQPDDPGWEWLKWSPHLHHPSEDGLNGPLRLIYPGGDNTEYAVEHGTSEQEEARQLAGFPVADLFARGRHQPDSTQPVGPWIVVVNLDPDTPEGFFPSDGVRGVTYITLGNITAQYQLEARADGSVHSLSRDGIDKTWQLLGAADTMTPQDADTFARRLAGWSVTGTQHATTAAPTVIDRSFLGLIGARDIAEITPARWREYAHNDRARLRFPFGHKPNGEPIALDIKQGAERGMGPHGMLIGATGSGKSSLLQTLLASAFATHSPTQLQAILCDWKGGESFYGMENLPHVQAIITDMEHHGDEVARFLTVMRGILYQRKQIIENAYKKLGQSIGGFAGYEQKRQAGADLEPLPSLLVVIDEFAELMDKHEEFIEPWKSISIQGRGLGAHLLLATQSLENVARFWDKLKGNIHYGIGLYTTSTQESKLIIGTTDAHYINTETPGVGYLRVGSNDPVEFKAVWTGEPYRPTTCVVADTPVVRPRPVVSVREFTATSSKTREQLK